MLLEGLISPDDSDQYAEVRELRNGTPGATLQPGLPQRIAYSWEIPAGSGFRKGYRLSYEFAPGWRYACLKPREGSVAKLGSEARTLGFWFHGDGQGNLLRMRFQDATGQVFQPDYGPVDWKGWRWITFPLDNTAAGRWGGMDDGVIRYPIKIETAVLIDSANRLGGKGEMFATGFTIFNESGK